MFWKTNDERTRKCRITLLTAKGGNGLLLTFAILSWSIPNTSFIRWYASQMSCMSPYSMPLWTIFTKCPAPSSPTWASNYNKHITDYCILCTVYRYLLITFHLKLLYVYMYYYINYTIWNDITIWHYVDKPSFDPFYAYLYPTPEQAGTSKLVNNPDLDTHPVTAWLPCAHLSSNALKDVLDVWPVHVKVNSSIITENNLKMYSWKNKALTMLPCVRQASVMARSEPPPLLHSLRCPQTTGLSPLSFYTDAAHRFTYVYVFHILRCVQTSIVCV